MASITVRNRPWGQVWRVQHRVDGKLRERTFETLVEAQLYAKSLPRRAHGTRKGFDGATAGEASASRSTAGAPRNAPDAHMAAFLRSQRSVDADELRARVNDPALFALADDLAEAEMMRRGKALLGVSG